MKNSDKNFDEIAKGMSNISKKLAEMFGGLTEEKIKEILKSIKPTLSEAERAILENINKDYKWIARDKAENMLFIYQRKPYKNDYGNWLNGGTNHGLKLFNHLFQFITWQDEEPYNIEELLKN